MKKNYRIIPTFLLDNRSFVKTKLFKNPKYLGDPINIIRIFNDKFADEICILNISKSLNKNYFSYLKEIFSECFLPLSYGGKIKNIEDVRTIFKIGVDKIIFSTNLIKNKNLVINTVKEVGSQGVVGCINILERLNNYYIYLPETNEKIYNDEIINKIEEVISLGIGELILNFVSRDGTANGYDLKFLQRISKRVNIPLIVLGGAGSKKDFDDAINLGANAVAAGSYFVYMGKRNAVMLSYNK